MSLNRVILVGRLVKDLELKYSQSGVAVCRFNIAVNRTFKSGDGEQKADFPTILTFRKTAENAANFLRKGSLVGIDGRIQTGSYEKDGRTIYTTEIIADLVQFLEARNTSSNQSDGGNQSGQANIPNQQQNTQNRQETTQNQMYGEGDNPFSTDNSGFDVSSDDLPF